MSEIYSDHGAYQNTFAVRAMRRSRFNASRRVLGMVAIAVATTLPGLSVAEKAWPEKPVKLVVMASPGGVPDVVARRLGQYLSEDAGAEVIIENRPGAGGNVAARHVAESSPDGYTLLVTGVNHAVNQTLLPKPGFDYSKDLAGVTGLVQHNLLFMASPKLPVGSIKELIEFAKKKPGGLSMVITSIGTPNHLAALLLASSAEIEPVYVPYAGIMPAIPDLVEGRVDVAVSSVTAALPMIKEQRVNPIAVTGRVRSALASDVPTVAESGIPDFDVTSWIVLLAPGGTPKDVLDTISAKVQKALATDKAKQELGKQDLTVWTTTPDEVDRHIVGEVSKWRKTLQDANVQITK